MVNCSRAFHSFSEKFKVRTLAAASRGPGQCRVSSSTRTTALRIVLMILIATIEIRLGLKQGGERVLMGMLGMGTKEGCL